MDRFDHKNPIFWLDCRFYQCFESIQLYGVSLVQLVDDLEGGRLVKKNLKIYIFRLLILRYIQQSLETLLRLQEGRQLLAEV